MKYIYGLSKSGQSLINYLDKIKESYYCWDDSIVIRRKLINQNKKINLVEPKKLNLNLIKESFISPGISLNNKKLYNLKLKKIKLFRDLELYSRITNDKKIIAVTGTNGKSTTVKLISNLLSKDSTKNFLGGNIGIPLMDFIKKDNKIKYHVLELSSFQLESTNSFNPYISILLNISKDHLDKYKSFKEYASQKEKIFNFKKNNFNIICVDDNKTFKIFQNNKKNFIPISLYKIKKGIFFKDEYIIDNYFSPYSKTKLDSISSHLFGSFNIVNILILYAVSKILDIKVEKFLKTVKNFKGLPHRMEKIFKNDFFQVINNSKATNLHSTIKSIYNFNNINLILGGKAKEKKFTEILKYKKNITKVYLIGESSNLIYKQIKKEINCEICENINNAVKKIFLDIKRVKAFQTILLAPACTSYDQFQNFEERGDCFKKIIKDIVNEYSF